LLIVLYFLSPSLQDEATKQSIYDLEQYGFDALAMTDDALLLRLPLPAAFVGTFLPLARASGSPIAIACLRLFRPAGSALFRCRRALLHRAFDVGGSFPGIFSCHDLPPGVGK
jgi:hypothetical protein